MQGCGAIISTGSEAEVGFQALVALAGGAVFFYDLIFRGGLILQ